MLMQFEDKGGIHKATNCLVELEIVEITNAKVGYETWTTYAVETEDTHKQFDTFNEAVRYAECEFGIYMNMKAA